MAACSWKHFLCTRTQLCLDIVLAAGQSFRWKKNSSGEWMGVMAGLVWRLKQTDDRIQYQVYGPVNFSQTTSRNKSYDQRGHENFQYQATDLKHESDGCNLKQKESPVVSCHEELMTQIKDEVTQDSEEVELFNGGDNNKPPQVCHSVGLKRKKQKAGKEVTTKQKKCSKYDEAKLLPVGASAKNENLGLKQFQNGEIFPKQICKTEPISQSLNSITEYFDINNHRDIHHSLLHDYFQFGVDLNCLYQEWSSKDPHFKKVGGNFQGVRLLRQDPTECLLSFVCSSNNHISRISSMVEKLCTHYGNHITSIDGEEYYTFPQLSALCGDDVDSHLRELGFGYRAKFIASIAKHVTQDKGEGWLESLRERSYTEAKAELLTLLGVGAKVADCVCLMSLDKPEALPVDTHVWQITLKNYMAKLHGAKTLTETIYNEIGDFYRKLWGPYAGWAQAVLFAADLRHNKDRNERNADAACQSLSDVGDSKQELPLSKAKRKLHNKPVRGRQKKNC